MAMKDSIYTIPISEVFEPRDGCPLCRLRDLLEERAIDYILGAAMMEPDVREGTNKLGFCAAHYNRMLARKSRLQMALTMQTRLASLLDTLDRPRIPAKPEREPETCYVCDRVDWALDRMCSNIYQTYAAQEDFRRLFAEQTVLCWPHYRRLLNGASELPKRLRQPFADECARLCRAGMDPLFEDVSHFCRMFDYRAAGESWGNSRDSIERGVAFLTSRKPE